MELMHFPGSVPRHATIDNRSTIEDAKPYYGDKLIELRVRETQAGQVVAMCCHETFERLVVVVKDVDTGQCHNLPVLPENGKSIIDVANDMYTHPYGYIPYES